MLPDKPFGKHVGPTIAVAGVFAALAAGAAVSLSPVVGLLLLAAVLGGLAFFVLPAAWMSAGSLVLVMAFAALVPVNATTGLLAFGPLAGVSSLAFVCVSLAALVFLKSGPGILLRGGKTTILAAVFFLLFVVVSFSNGIPDSQVFLAQWAVWVSAFALAVYTPGRLVAAVVGAWILMGFLGGAYAIYEFLARPGVLYEGYLTADAYRGVLTAGGGAGLTRAQATFGHPIPLGTFLVTTAVLALWAVRFPPGRYLGVLRLAVLATLLAGAVVTFSRSGWVAFFVAVGVGLAARRSSGWEKIGTAALFIVPAVVLLQTPLGDNIVGYVAGIEETLSFQGRAASLASVPQIFSAGVMSALLGTGAGSSQGIYEALGFQSYQGLQIIDNQYITMLAQVGLIGLGIFLAMAFSALGGALKGSSRLASGIGFALLAALTAIFFYDGLAWPSTAILVWSLLGFLARHNGEMRAESFVGAAASPGAGGRTARESAARRRGVPAAQGEDRG